MPDAGILTVGVIGLGRIGQGVSSLVSDAGHDVRGFDVSPAALDAVSAHTVAARSPADAANGADCVLLAVYNDEQVRDVLESEDGVFAAHRPAPVVVVLSTVSIETIRAEHVNAQEQGIHLLDCGVSGGRKIRGGERMAASVGGDPAAFQAVKSVLEAFADPVVYMGPSGAGMVAKVARNMLHFCSVLADFESLTLAGAAGLDLDAYRTFVMAADRNSGGRMGYGEKGDISRNESFANYAVKDLAAARQLAAEVGVTVPEADAAAGVYEDLRAKMTS